MSDFEKFKAFKKAKANKEDVEQIKEAWFYPRVSSKNQFDTNDSIENQSDVSYSYAKRNNILITKTFGGTYESASGDFTRKEFMRLINEVKRSRKRPKYILIYIMSRFSRTGGNAIALANMLVEDMGVHIIETSSGLSTETDIGKMSVYQKLIEARKETLSRLDSTIPGMKSALLNGKWLGAVPKGYTKYGPRVVDPERYARYTRIEINKEGKLLKLAWKWKTQGERDVDIRAKLKARGLIINSKRMSEIWRKPFYAGIIIHNLIDQIVEGDWEPLVSKKDFLKINQLLDEHNHVQIGYNVESTEELRPLSGDLICSECGAKLTSYKINKRPKNKEAYQIHYYNCYNCKAVTINANSSKNSKSIGAHNQFKNILSSYKVKDKYFALLETYLIQMTNYRSEDYKKEIKEDKKKLTELKKELESLEERFAFGKIPENIYQKFANKLESQIIKLDKKIIDGNYSTSNRLKLIEDVIEKTRNLDEYWSCGDLPSKKRVQKAVFPEGIVVKADIKRLLTDKRSIYFNLMIYFSRNYKHKKSGEPNEKFDFPASVRKDTEYSNQLMRDIERICEVLNIRKIIKNT